MVRRASPPTSKKQLQLVGPKLASRRGRSRTSRSRSHSPGARSRERHYAAAVLSSTDEDDPRVQTSRQQAREVLAVSGKQRAKKSPSRLKSTPPIPHDTAFRWCAPVPLLSHLVPHRWLKFVRNTVTRFFRVKRRWNDQPEAVALAKAAFKKSEFWGIGYGEFAFHAKLYLARKRKGERYAHTHKDREGERDRGRVIESDREREIWEGDG